MDEEGLFTLIWGPTQWEALHNITFNYPYNPSDEIKKNYFDYFTSLSNVLPCCTCRKNFKNHVTSGDTKLTYEHLKNRDTLTKWLYNFHKTVCKRMGFEYDITYERMCKRYNSFIAKCELTREQKQEAFKNFYNKEAPILKYDVLLCFSEYAKERGIIDYDEKIKKYFYTDRNSEEWEIRNNECQNIMKHMRLNGICGIEQDGKYKNMPSIEELNMMSYASTTICWKDIKKIMKKILKKKKELAKFNNTNNVVI